MRKQVSWSRQLLMAGAILFLSAACQPNSGQSNGSMQSNQQPQPSKMEMGGGACKTGECAKECPKKECPCPTECKKPCPCPTECPKKECPKKECPCPKECPKKECPCPKECPKKECPCPAECNKCPSGCCEVEMKKQTQTSAASSEVRSEVKSEPTISTRTTVETPAS